MSSGDRPWMPSMTRALLRSCRPLQWEKLPQGVAENKTVLPGLASCKRFLNLVRMLSSERSSFTGSFFASACAFWLPVAACGMGAASGLVAEGAA